MRPAFWATVRRFDRARIAPSVGLRNAAGVALPLALGLAFRAPGSGLLIATGALNVAFSDSRLPYTQRARRMLAASAVVGYGVFIGALCGHSHPLTLLTVTLWAFAAGILVALDQTAADVGTISLVTVLVFAALPMPPQQALYSGVLAGCGGLLQIVLSVAIWPLRPYAPQRRALADLFRALADSAAVAVAATEAPPVTAQTTEAQDWLAPLDRDRSLEAERYRALLSQAERMRLALLVLSRVRTRIAREDPASCPVATIDRFFTIAGDVLRGLAAALARNTPPEDSPALVDETHAIVESLRACPGEMARDARRQIDALAGQFRAAFDLVEHATPAGELRFERGETARSWPLRLQSGAAILRANLTLRSAACRHAIRLAVCVAIAEAVGQQLALTRAYWAPMTVAIVLKPDFAGTFSRGVQRLAGTIAGLLLATALVHFRPLGTGLEIAFVAIFTFAARAFGPANYAIAATAITALVVMLVALNGTAPGAVVLPRAINTIVGGAIALIAHAVWPTWERAQIPEMIARLLDAYAAYWSAIRAGYEQPDRTLSREVDEARLGGRRARTNLEASMDRLAIEPGTTHDRFRALSALLANSHRLAHAMMALEAGLVTTRSAPPRPAFKAFADDVAQTLSALAAHLRGTPVDPATLPDLRESHHELLRAGETVERYALVNIETDRVVNSLNTLAADIFAL
jgi:uncharacterized membrane protein YccC